MNRISLMRYPGGKAKIYFIVRKIVEDNNLSQKTYVEPFAGGFGLGLKLLLNKNMKGFIINDLDRHIYAFWFSVFNDTERLINKIEVTEITLLEWHKQKQVYANHEQHSLLDVGFSTLFLNRTNFSGILSAGPLGGVNQDGKYKLDCRFNKRSIIDTIRLVSKHKEYVEVYNMDAIHLIEYLKVREQDVFYNFDPPYVGKGKELYLNAYEILDHVNLRNEVNKVKAKWIMTYDNVELIKNLYDNHEQVDISLSYSVSSKRKENELMISNISLKSLNVCASSEVQNSAN